MSQGIIWMRWIIEICVWKDLMWMRGKGDWWQGWCEAACQPRHSSHVKLFWLTSVRQTRFGPVLSFLFGMSLNCSTNHVPAWCPALGVGPAHWLTNNYFVLDLRLCKSHTLPHYNQNSIRAVGSATWMAAGLLFHTRFLQELPKTLTTSPSSKLEIKPGFNIIFNIHKVLWS